jgi:hypothetical protein
LGKHVAHGYVLVHDSVRHTREKFILKKHKNTDTRATKQRAMLMMAQKSTPRERLAFVF